MRSFLSVVTVIALLASSTVAHPLDPWDTSFSAVRRAISPDETCGLTGAGTNGYTCGASNVGPCCSQYGWCGVTTDHCGTGCQTAYGTCTGATTTLSTNTASSTTTSTGLTNTGTGTADPDTEGRCGPYYANQVCSDNQCCSSAGYCGTTKDHCKSPDCLLGYGRCDADTIPSGVTTLTGSRDLVGSIAYGAEIYNCQEEGTLAMTFDDGPYIYTNDILDLLATYNAKATFFVTGINNGKGRIDDTSLPWAAMITRMIAEGHQVASHTWSHADLSTLTEAVREGEMVKNEMALRNIIGKWPTYMRPPYSSCNNDCMATMQRLGYHIIYFDFDTQDYLHTTPETQELSKIVVRNQLAIPADNWLSISHDIHEQTAHNLTSYFLEQASAKGFRFVTVGECLGDPEANWYRTST